MSELDSPKGVRNSSTSSSSGGSGLGLWLGIGGAYILLSAFVMFSMYGRIQHLETGMATSDEQQARLAQRLDASESSVTAVNTKLGTTTQEIETRSEQLQKQH